MSADSPDSKPTTSRRRFLQGAVAAAALSRLGDARAAVAEQLSELQVASDFRDLASQYSLGADVVYLNHASIGTIPRVVREAHRRYLDVCEENPWLHMWGGEWEEPREQVRARAAALLACDADDLTFSHNTTETFNLLAQGLPLGPGDEVLTSSLNHSGAGVCWTHFAESRGYSVRTFDFPVERAPELTRKEAAALYLDQIRPETKVLVFPHVDNRIGLRHPLPEIALEAKKRGVRWIAVDAAQTVGMLPLDLPSLGVDVYATSAHKWLQGPKGLGLAWIRREVQEELRPMWVTWGRERWAENARKYEDYGTRNLAAVLALGDAIAFQEKLGAEAKEAHHQMLWNKTREMVEADDRLIWRSPSSWDLSAALYAVEIRGKKSRDVSTRVFREHGVVVRPFDLPGLQTLRISPNASNHVEEIERVLDLFASG